MTVLRWLSLVECMWRCHVVPGRTARTSVLLRMRLNWPVLLMIDVAWGYPYVLSKYTAMAMTALRAFLFVRWMYGTGVMLTLNDQRVRLHCCVRAWIWKRYCFWMQYAIVISPSRSIQIHYNDYDNGSTLIFAGWIYETGIVLALDEQNVSLYCCFVAVWCSISS